MYHPCEIVYRSNFTILFFHNEIEQFKSEIQKINKSDNLNFEIIRNENNKVFDNQSKSYTGNYLEYSISENGEMIGYLNCLNNIENNYFILFTLPI